MRLTTALNDYKRQRGERFPEETRTTRGTFAGDGGRLVHVSESGALRDHSAPLCGLHGIDRSRLGIETDAGVDWFDGLDTLDQHYYRGTTLVETEFDAGAFTVHQYDLTLGRSHVTHVEVRGRVPPDARLVAFLTAAPEGQENVGALVHESAGPDETRALEVYHRREHDYVAASTGLDRIEGQRPESFAEDVDADAVSFPRAGGGGESRLTGDFLLSAPLEAGERGVRTTLVTRLAAHGETGREAALADVRARATGQASADDVRATARGRHAVDVPEGTPLPGQVRTDLRTLAFLRGEAGGRVAAPEFDPFYANSGGYGYVWFRDDASAARRLLDAGDRLGLDVHADLLAAAECFCDAQLADGTWPHRVWASDGTVAPGWANARVEGRPDGDDYQADQTAAATAFLASLLAAREERLPPGLATSIREAVRDGVAALDASIAANGLPARCQNCWEDAAGQFAHTTATYLDAYVAVAGAPLDAATTADAAASADDLVHALDALWLPGEGRYAMRLDHGKPDDRADAASLRLVGAFAAYAEHTEGSLSETHLERLRAHVESTLDALHRDPARGDVAGLARYTGDAWRADGQAEPKVWSLTTALGATACARLDALLAAHGRDGGRFRERARAYYELLGDDGPFTTGTGLLAEQAFDDGTLDGATPLGWSHAVRLHATALLADRGALPDASTATPPERPRWTTGEKYGVCTAADGDTADPSKVWFTLTRGALSEVRFPRVDVANVRTLDFLVRCPADGHTVRTHAERGDPDDGVRRRVEPVGDDALRYRHVIAETGVGDDYEWTLTAEYATDPGGDALLADVDFEAADGRTYEVYAVGDVTLANADAPGRAYVAGEAGAHDLLAREPTGDPDGEHDPRLVDADGTRHAVAVALRASDGFDWASVAAAGGSRLDALFAGDALPEARPSLTDESAVLVGRLGIGEGVSRTLALGFARRGDTASALDEAGRALERGYDAVRDAYVETWRTALADVSTPDEVRDDPELAAQYRTAVASLLAVEDKTYRGAAVASPSVPWGEAVTVESAAGDGYNFVWARDLYQVFSVFLAAGDTETAARHLTYVYEHQQDETGFVPQNTYVNGVTRWGGEQLDNVALPQVMAYQLWAAGVGFEDVAYGYEHVRRSADYVARNGPSSQQERWEEEAGYSPSTIAAEIAGLVCAGTLADETGRVGDALPWLALADEWAGRVEEWTATDDGTGRHRSTPYYVRVTRDGNPDAGHARRLANAGPTLDERDVLDAGFLELVRLGIKPADDPVIRNSLREVDATIRVDVGEAAAFYRYNGDGYGERATGEKGGPWTPGSNGTGRLWPLLTGERGEYELRAGGPDAARPWLRTMAAFANTGQMLPEQVWDRRHPTKYGWEFGEGTGSATPLSWSMAQYARLALGIDAGEPVETPAVVAERYHGGRHTDPDARPTLDVSLDADGDALRVTGETDGVLVAAKAGGETAVARPDGGAFALSLDTAASDVVVAAAETPELSTARTSVRRLTR
ncbi:glucoamylase (plasmid) [Halarchaeum sp. CBA1220]|uniref:glycoside hydrolase family 15 protein n=1 Tax=Halarchaeum sp. CBA1220 TaxID=1853682 RepID=UPI000F3AA95A|nr:glycoside hydrolase family 15 protein [Halarchaeum sp. CBA1220]QLC34965.1 glucoamylase [Halarchaeum sp. CBA1220]